VNAKRHGDHSPDTLKSPNISLTSPRQCAALTPTLSGTHNMPVLLVLNINDQTIKFTITS